MIKEELTILTLCMLILFLTGFLETMYVTVLPYVILKSNSELREMNTNCSIDKTPIYNFNLSTKDYIDKKVSVITSVKYITRVSFGPLPGILIDKVGCLKVIILGLSIEFCSIIISFFSYDRILIHSIMRILDAASLVCMNTSSFALIWIVFHTKGTHPIYLGILNMLYTFGTFVGPYIGTFLNSYLGFNYLPIFTSFIFSICLTLWIFIFISSKRNQKYIDIIYKTTTNAHECKLDNDICEVKKQDQISGDTNDKDFNSNNKIEIFIIDDHYDEYVDIGNFNENNDTISIIKDDDKNKIINTEDRSEKEINITLNMSNKTFPEPLNSTHQYNDNVDMKVSGDVIQTPNKPKTEIQKVTLSSFFMFFRLLFNPYVFLCFLGIFTSQMSVTLFSSTLPMWIIQRYKVSQRKAGVIWLPGSIISLIIPIILIVVFKKWSKIRYLGTLITAFIQGLGCLIMPFYPQYWNVAFTILFSVINILMNEYVYFPMIFDIITDKYGAELSGRSSIITNMAVSSGMLFGSLVGGHFVNIIGFKSFYIVIGALYIIVSFLNIIMKKYST